MRDGSRRLHAGEPGRAGPARYLVWTRFRQFTRWWAPVSRNRVGDTTGVDRTRHDPRAVCAQLREQAPPKARRRPGASRMDLQSAQARLPNRATRQGAAIRNAAGGATAEFQEKMRRVGLDGNRKRS